MDPDRERPPSRHQGSRLVTRQPSVVRALATMRATTKALASRVRPEEVTFTDADPARGVPIPPDAFGRVHVAYIYRSGHALYVDLLMATGVASTVEARLAVPDLGLSGAAAVSAAGGDQVLRVTLVFPGQWLMGEAHLVYTEARRVTGTDATTSRPLRARQR